MSELVGAAHLAVDAVWMITLGTLGTCQQLALHALAKAATNHTHVLQGDKGEGIQLSTIPSEWYRGQ